jgi:tetratricopeptide (TPR) repeat protein
MSNKIEEKLDSIDWQNYDEVISFYEENKLYYSNYLIQSNIEIIISMLWVKLAYCYALTQKHRYSQTTTVFEHIEQLIEKLDKDNDPDYERIYERFLFNKGFALGRQRKYYESQVCFKKLIAIDPQNELYRDWYESNKIDLIYKKTRIVGYTAFVCLMFLYIQEIAFDKDINYKVSLTFFIIMMISFSSRYILKAYKHFTK